MRRKIFSVSLDLILPALCRDDRQWTNRIDLNGKLHFIPPRFITCDGMPPDARIIDIRPNPAFQGQLDMLIESDTFPDVPAGVQCPYVDVRMTTYTSYETYLEMEAKKKKLGTLPQDTGGSVPFGPPGAVPDQPKSSTYYVGEAAKMGERTVLPAVLYSADEVMTEVHDVLTRVPADGKTLAVLVRVPGSRDLLGEIKERVRKEHGGDAVRSPVGDACGVPSDFEWIKVTVPCRKRGREFL